MMHVSKFRPKKNKLMCIVGQLELGTHSFKERIKAG